jgi:hypothetical protein
MKLPRGRCLRPGTASCLSRQSGNTWAIPLWFTVMLPEDLGFPGFSRRLGAGSAGIHAAGTAGVGLISIWEKKCREG